MKYKYIIMTTRAVDSDPHGSALSFRPGSGSWRETLEVKIVKKCMEIVNNCNKKLNKSGNRNPTGGTDGDHSQQSLNKVTFTKFKSHTEIL